MLSSTVCRYEHFQTQWYQDWAEKLRLPLVVEIGARISHRKHWEWAAIMESISSRGLLNSKVKCLGFAVGQEPLPSLMASYGNKVLATDLMISKVDQGWIDTGQHSTTLEHLYYPDIIDRASFESNVAFKPVDMIELNGLTGKYDFIWSSCAFEHLGTLENGLNFVKNAMSFVKPGGYAFHTTEYNVTSNADTVEQGMYCIYRKKDLLRLDLELRTIGCAIEKIDFDPGSHPYDLTYDVLPFFENNRPHIKLLLNGFVATSILIVVRKGFV